MGAHRNLQILSQFRRIDGNTTGIRVYSSADELIVGYNMNYMKYLKINGHEAVCDDCGKQIEEGNKEDEMAYFNNSRCAEDEAKLLAYMKEYNEKEYELFYS